MDSTVTKITTLASIFTAHDRRSESTISRLAVGSWDQIARLRKGKGITTHRAERMLNWFSGNWPADLEWPDDIPRPAAKEDAA